MSTATRVLIVEDKIVVANNLQDRLQRMGYAILGIVPSGEAAIRSVMELQPDIVLMDIRLQGEIDGIQAAQEIRAGCDVPIIYLTGHADETTLQRARLTEPYGYLLKPFDALGLRSTIEMALYRHAAERRIRESEEKYRTRSDKLERRVEARTADLAQANFLLKQEVAERQQAEEALRRRNRELALLNRVI
jgi:AmiR/NasT family two-component response regulator